MDEIKRLEKLKAYKNLLDDELIDIDDFNKLKTNVLNDKKTKEISYFEPLKIAFELVKKGIISIDDYNSLKNQFVLGTAKQTTLDLEKLSNLYGLIKENAISDDDFSFIKDKLIDGKKVSILNNINILKICKKLQDEIIISIEEFEYLKELFLLDNNKVSSEKLESLRDYKSLVDENLIDLDDFNNLKASIIVRHSIKTPNEIKTLLEEYKELLIDNVINNDDYNKKKASVIPNVVVRPWEIKQSEQSDQGTKGKEIKKAIIITLGVVIAIAIGILAFIFSSSEWNFNLKEAQTFEVEGLTCLCPMDWEVETPDDKIAQMASISDAETDEYLLCYYVEYLGECEDKDKLMSLVMDSIAAEETPDFITTTIPSCDNALEYKYKNVDEQDIYLRAVQCKDRAFLFLAIATTKNYFINDEIVEMFDAVKFSDFSPTEIEETASSVGEILNSLNGLKLGDDYETVENKVVDKNIGKFFSNDNDIYGYPSTGVFKSASNWYAELDVTKEHVLNCIELIADDNNALTSEEADKIIEILIDDYGEPTSKDDGSYIWKNEDMTVFCYIYKSDDGSNVYVYIANPKYDIKKEINNHLEGKETHLVEQI